MSSNFILPSQFAIIGFDNGTYEYPITSLANGSDVTSSGITFDITTYNTSIASIDIVDFVNNGTNVSFKLSVKPKSINIISGVYADIPYTLTDNGGISTGFIHVLIFKYFPFYYDSGIPLDQYLLSASSLNTTKLVSLSTSNNTNNNITFTIDEVDNNPIFYTSLRAQSITNPTFPSFSTPQPNSVDFQFYLDSPNANATIPFTVLFQYKDVLNLTTVTPQIPNTSIPINTDFDITVNITGFDFSVSSASLVFTKSLPNGVTIVNNPIITGNGPHTFTIKSTKTMQSTLNYRIHATGFDSTNPTRKLEVLFYNKFINFNSLGVSQHLVADNFRPVDGETIFPGFDTTRSSNKITFDPQSLLNGSNPFTATLKSTMYTGDDPFTAIVNQQTFPNVEFEYINNTPTPPEKYEFDDCLSIWDDILGSYKQVSSLSFSSNTEVYNNFAQLIGTIIKWKIDPTYVTPIVTSSNQSSLFQSNVGLIPTKTFFVNGETDLEIKSKIESLIDDLFLFSEK